MSSYKDPPLHDRRGQAADAKIKALQQLRSKAPVDETRVAERVAADQQRAVKAAESAATKKASQRAAKESKAAAKTSAPMPLTDADKKAARDARYAGRKKRR